MRTAAMFRYSKPPGRSGTPRRGVAIITVLLILVMLAAMTFLLTQLSATDYADAKSVVDATTTLYLADAGIEYAIMEIKHNLPIAGKTSTDPTNPDPTNKTGTEHVVIDEFNYASTTTNNWIANEAGIPAVGTFEIRQVSVLTATDPDGPGVVIQSIGRIRKKPLPSQDAQPDPNDTSPAGIAATNDYYQGLNGHLGIRQWTPLAKRTVNATLSFGASAPPAAGNAFLVKYWYEPYR